MRASLKVAMNNATKIMTDPHVECTKHLHEEMKVLAKQLSSIYKKLEFQGKFLVVLDITNFLYTSLIHSVDNFTSEQLEKMEDDEFYSVSLYSEYSWKVSIDRDRKKFILMFGYPESEDTKDCYLSQNIGYGLPQGVIEFSLNEYGFQDMICELSKQITSYLPVSVQLERMRRIDAKTGQRSLNFEQN